MRKILKSTAKDALKGRWGIIILVCFINLLLTGWTETSELIEMSSGKDYYINFKIANILLNCFLSVGLCKFNLEFVKKDEGEVKINLLFSYFKYYFKTLGLSLLKSLVIIVGFLLFIVPGVILIYSLSQTEYILAENPEMKIIDCLKESRRIMKGRKFDFFILELSFIGWIILSILTLGIGLLFLIPYMNITNTYFYLDAKNNSL